ncbi:MAG: ATP-binding cassette domain-containing protein [Polyangiaceae bacterium]|nr:ATP-binding cassette domain-containing protein [Polyangiaceae bacterium]
MPPAADYVMMQDATFRGPAGPCFPHTTWRLPAGERWAVRGVTGAGKSLFVAALTGRLPRLDGVLRHPFLEGDRRCRDSAYGVLPPGTIAVASMDQHRALLAAREFHQLRWHATLTNGRLTVAEHLARESVEGLSPFAVAAEDERAARYPSLLAREVARFDLGPLLPRPLLALSNGELHRLVLARALLQEPRLLVVDDPFAGLDAATRARLKELLARLPDEGTAVLHVAARDEEVPEDVTHELELGAGAVVDAGPRRSPRTATPSRARAGGGEAGPARPTATRSPDPPRAETVLELRRLTVRHRDLTLLADIDWTIRAGERWALVGPNGAGKSTLLAVVLADHPQAHASNVVVCGRRLGPGTSVWDVKRCLGWVSPELDAHYPAGTPALDVVLSGFRASLGVHHAPTDEERGTAAAWLERFGLSDRAATAFDATPRCERRLLLLARASVHEPRLLLLDEPCQGLDARDRARFAAALELALVTLQAALVYVTHDAGELPPGIDRILELAAG